MSGMSHHDVPLRRALPMFLLLYVPLVLLVVALGFWFVHEWREITLAHYRAEAQHHVEGQVDRIRRFYRQGQLMVRGFARDSAVLPALQGDGVARTEIGRVFENILVSLNALDQLRLLDARGREVVRVERRDGAVIRVSESRLQDKAHRDYVRRALKLPPGDIYVSPLDVNVEHGQIERPYKAVIRFVVVVGDGKHHVIGMLVANFLGLELMQQELAETRPPGEHLMINAGSAWWFDRHGARLDALNDEAAVIARHRLDAGIWRRLMRKKAGQLTDGDSLLTFARYRPDVVNDPKDVSEYPFPEQTEWRIISYVPLHREWTDVSTFGPALAVLVLLVLAGAALLLWVQHHLWLREAARQREAMMRANRRLLRRLFRLREEERAHLARLMHDEIGQRLTGIQMQAAAASRLCSAKRTDDAAVRKCLARVQCEIDEFVKLMRDQLRSFRPPPVRELGLVGAIEGYCEQWSRETGIRCEIQVDPAVNGMPHDSQIQIYRIVQESLTNVVRHAHASCVRLSLAVERDELLMTIEDNGKGFESTRAAEGLGLAGMRERAQLLHGQLHLERIPEGGARVVLRAPYACQG